MCPIKEKSIFCNYNGSHFGQADILWALAELSITENNLERCDFYSRRALKFYTELDSDVGIAFSRSIRGQLRMTIGDISGAYREFNYAIETFRKANLNTRLAECLCFRAELAFTTGLAPTQLILVSEPRNSSPESWRRKAVTRGDRTSLRGILTMVGCRRKCCSSPDRCRRGLGNVAVAV